MRLNIKPDSKMIVRMLAGIAVVMAIASLASEYVVEIVFAGQDNMLLLDFLDLLSVNLEDSIPTWYSVLILFVASVLLFIIAKGKSQSKATDALHWWGLAFIFLYLSMDEGAVIHEIFAIPLQEAFNTDGFLTFGWQILAFPLVIIFGLVYLRFLFALPPKTRNLFILSGAIYVGGALIVEGFSAAQYEEAQLSMTYLGLATIEEFCEMLGVSIFIFTLLDYIQQMDYSLLFSMTDGNLSADDTVDSERASIKQSLPFNPMLLLIAFLILINLASFAWILGNRPQNIPVDIPAFYDAVRPELEAANVTIIEAPDTFGIENTHSLATVRALSATYDEIFVVAFPGDSRSVIFAGDSLPFDRDTLAEWLHDNGQVEFIIFDPVSISVMLDA